MIRPALFARSEMIYDLLVKRLLTRLARLIPRDALPQNDVSFDGKVLRLLTDPRQYSMLRWQQFLEQCFVPRVFYDIGANDPFSVTGQQQVYKPLMPQTRFFLFEAMAKHEPALERSKEPYAIAVLGSEDGAEKIFYETKLFAAGVGDSYYRDRTPVYGAEAVVETRHLTRRLDTLVAELGWPKPDFIKLDTQGSELDILRGAPACLAAAQGLQIECNIERLNEDAPMLADVLAFTENAGFRLFDVIQLHFAPWRQLVQVDAIFVRPQAVKPPPKLQSEAVTASAPS